MAAAQQQTEADTTAAASAFIKHWQGAPATDELLTRLVALNAKRAAEEKQGQVTLATPRIPDPGGERNA